MNEEEQYHYERLSRSLAEERDELAVQLTESTDALEKAQQVINKLENLLDRTRQCTNLIAEWLSANGMYAGDIVTAAQNEIDRRNRG